MIISLNKTHSLQIAKIHKKALGGDFLPSLGTNFLKTFYEGVMNQSGIYAFGFKEKETIQGFVMGTKDSNKFFSQAIRANFLKLSYLLVIEIFKNPKIIKNVIETFLYPTKDIGPKAELVVIAVDDKVQGKGVGKKLVAALEKAFRKNRINSYKLTVHMDKKAVGFYEHLKFLRISSFKLYDKMWFVYEKQNL